MAALTEAADGRRHLVLWHRRDLRLHDNQLYAEIKERDQVDELVDPSDSFDSCTCIYCFDPTHFSRVPSMACSGWDAIRTGPHATVVLLDSLHALRAQLRGCGGELYLAFGDPAEELTRLVGKLGPTATAVRWAEEPGVEEEKTSARVRNALVDVGCRVSTHVSSPLYSADQLPHSAEDWHGLAHPRQKQRKRAKAPPSDMHGWRERLSGMPSVMGDWRRAMRAAAQPPLPLPAPTRLPPPPTAALGECGDLPSVQTVAAEATAPSARLLLGLSPECVAAVIAHAARRSGGASPNLSATTDTTAATAPGRAACFRDVMADETRDRPLAGEPFALERLRTFVQGGAASTAERSGAMASENDASHLSKHLAVGALSARQVHATAANDVSTRWLASHMEIRDFFIFSAFAARERLFRLGGSPVATHAATQWQSPANADATPTDAWRRWTTGTTGLPLVDAAMTELLTTGYCSNRVRQNLASVLTKDLQIDWRAGAELFQWLLEDHDVAANYGNWAYFAGVGADPKNRHFRTISQALKYDARGDYVRMWLPKLRDAHIEAVLWPFGQVDGWPAPLVPAETQLAWQDAARLAETGALAQTEPAEETFGGEASRKRDANTAKGEKKTGRRGQH